MTLYGDLERLDHDWHAFTAAFVKASGLRALACRLGFHHWIYIGRMPFGRAFLLIDSCGVCQVCRVRGPVEE